MTQPQVEIEGASVADIVTRAYEHAYEQGWTDGLPIIPATPEAVARFISASGRAADELIGTLPPREKNVLDLVDGERTVRQIVVASHLSSFDACRTLVQFLEARVLRRR